MAQDLKKLFEKEREQNAPKMKDGHENRFLDKLEEQLPANEESTEVRTPSKSFSWYRIAASVVVILGLGIYFFFDTGDAIEGNQVTTTEKTKTEENQGISLGDLSPDLKKIESYYVTNINLELSDLEFTGENKAIVDGYMLRLADLDKEYERLTTELNAIGPNDGTISALIQNLQLRLQLLQKLKTKLNQLKSSKNEQETTNIV